MTTSKRKSQTSAKKPKHVSKTKQELRRLREFAGKFALPLNEASGVSIGGVDIYGKPYLLLRDEAIFALTGKKSPAIKRHDQLAADVKRLSSMSREQMTAWLNEGDAPPSMDNGKDDAIDVALLPGAKEARLRGARPPLVKMPPQSRRAAGTDMNPTGRRGYPPSTFVEQTKVSQSVNDANRVAEPAAK